MEKIKIYFKNLKAFNFKLFIALCLTALIPAIYQTVRTFIISSTVSTAAFDVIGQMEWFDLINETLLSFLIVPLYSILNRLYNQYKNDFSTAVFKIGLIVFGIYFVFSLAVFFYGVHLVNAMNPAEVDVAQVSAYLQLETVAFIVGVIVSYVNVTSF